MFSKFLSSAALVLAVLHQAHAHAAVAPALGVNGTPVRGNVQRPSNNSPCGNVNIATALDTSTAVQANAQGVFSTTAINFNGGADGSRRVTAKVDATGKGTSFVAATVTTNGDAAPNNVGSQPIVASLPAGTKCTGGKTGNKCLVQFVTSAGFGNCVVVSQGAAAGGSAAGTGGAAAGTAAGAAGGAAAGAAAGTAAGNANANNGNGRGNATANANNGNGRGNGRGRGRGGRGRGRGRQGQAAAGTRAARALLAELAELEARAEEGIEVVKREVSGWFWA